MDPAALMTRYCAGDPSALRELYAAVGPALLASLVETTDTPEGAAELVQRTFLELHRTRGAYVRGASPVPWLHAIARGVAARARGDADQRVGRASSATALRMASIKTSVRR